MLGRIETRTRDRIYCQMIRTVRDISLDDRAIIVRTRRVPVGREIINVYEVFLFDI